MEREGSFAFLNLRSCAICGVVCEHIQGSGIVCPVRVHDVLLLGCVTGVLVVSCLAGTLVRPSSCLVAGCTLLVGVVKMTGGSERVVASCCDCKGLGL